MCALFRPTIKAWYGQQWLPSWEETTVVLPEMCGGYFTLSCMRDPLGLCHGSGAIEKPNQGALQHLHLNIILSNVKGSYEQKEQEPKHTG